MIVRVGHLENYPKKLPVNFSSSPFTTMGLVWGEGGRKGAGEGQDCKWDPNSFKHNPKANTRKVYWQRRNCRTHFSSSDKLFTNDLLFG